MEQTSRLLKKAASSRKTGLPACLAFFVPEYDIVIAVSYYA